VLDIQEYQTRLPLVSHIAAGGYFVQMNRVLLTPDEEASGPSSVAGAIIAASAGSEML
jgi:hypothetical protein